MTRAAPDERGDPGRSERRIGENLVGARLDHAVKDLFALSTAAARRLCAAGRVRLNQRIGAKGDRVAKGDLVVVIGGEGWFVANDAPALVVVAEGHDIVVVDKPAGVACHPLLPGEGGTVADAIVARWPEAAVAADDEREAGLLHRLDTGTSGCLAFARSRAAWLRGRQALLEAEKTYLALVVGDCRAVVVDAPIGHAGDVMRLDEHGMAARTEVEPVLTTTHHSLIRLSLHGGRRHQLRVHLASLGHPLVGDTVYGGPSATPTSATGSPAFFLHAWRLRLKEPTVVAEAALPAAFRAALAALSLGDALRP